MVMKSSWSGPAQAVHIFKASVACVSRAGSLLQAVLTTHSEFSGDTTTLALEHLHHLWNFIFRADDGVSVYTLHGHTGPITCIFIDRHSPLTAGSASQDGMLCVWDLLTGACMYSIQVK